MKMLLTGSVNWTEEQKNEIKEYGNEIIYIQDERVPLNQQSIDVACIEGVICNGLFLYNDIAKFINLRYIQLTSAGFDRIPMDYVEKHHIEIHNARGVYSIPMAEFAISGVLQLYKQSEFFHENQKQHKWKKNREILELKGKRVCIVGCGSVGTECAKRFGAFGCRVIGVDLYPKADEYYEEMLKLENLEDALSKSDVVVLTLPLTVETKHLINAERLKIMKQGAVLVNIARGSIVNTEELVKGIDHLRGAVLDVLDEEPLASDSVLWDMENVIITPHNSFVGEGNKERLYYIIIENIKKSKISFCKKGENNEKN